MEKISVVYPIGKFSPIKTYNDALIKDWITEIGRFPTDSLDGLKIFQIVI